MSFAPLIHLVACKETEAIVSEESVSDMDSIAEESEHERQSVDLVLVPQLPPVKFHDFGEEDAGFGVSDACLLFILVAIGVSTRWRVATVMLQSK